MPDLHPKRMALRRLLILATLTGLVSACTSIQHKPMAASQPPVQAQLASASSAQGRHIAVFLDGTHNDEGSDTNVKRLHSLVTLQNRADISSLYVQGVGVTNDVVGATTGAGINARVRLAYEFIYNHYQPGDKIYIFGFSRGAYSARQLSSMLYYAGLPKQRAVMNSKEVAESVHQAVFPVLRADRYLLKDEARWSWARQRLAAGPLGVGADEGGDGKHAYRTDEVQVHVLGLWDTVEALGFPNYQARMAHRAGLKEFIPDVDEANYRYGEKLCNVQNAFHALSIDDNREWIFTPLLLTRPHLFRGCVPGGSLPIQDANGHVGRLRLQEVWFSGAHSDVGGGYGDSLLSGTSLNWMIERLQALVADTESAQPIEAAPAKGEGTAHTAGGVSARLLPPKAAVRQDIFGSTHDAEQGTAGGFAYRAVHRNLVRYATSSLSDEEPWLRELLNGFQGTLCVHPSVFERRTMLPLQPHENPQLRLTQPAEACLKQVPRSLDPGRAWLAEDTQAQVPCSTTVKVMRYPLCPGIGLPSARH